MSARALAREALALIDDGAYANLATAGLLGAPRAAHLSPADRHLVTMLVNGTTRMRRNLDIRIDTFARGPLDCETRRVLRLGAYQLCILGVPAHAAVNETVKLAPLRSRGLVNAVLRRLSTAQDPLWPIDAARLSYPDWIVERLRSDLRSSSAETLNDNTLADETLLAMNEPPEVHVREDGYTQGRSSQAVADAVGARRGERILDLCAAPGGKATALAATGASIVATDIHPNRSRLIVENAERVGALVEVVTADGTRLPFRSATFDRVLVDAPCSGLGALHRRPDARWRIQPSDVDDLVTLQRALIVSGLDVLRPGGTLVYSVCTLTLAESLGIDEWLRVEHPELEPLLEQGPPWRRLGRGSRVLPQDLGSDGMCLFRYRVLN